VLILLIDSGLLSDLVYQDSHVHLDKSVFTSFHNTHKKEYPRFLGSCLKESTCVTLKAVAMKYIIDYYDRFITECIEEK